MSKYFIRHAHGLLCFVLWSNVERTNSTGCKLRNMLNREPRATFLGFTIKKDWAPSQYPKRRLSVRSRKVSKPRDLYLELSDRSEIWQALRQHCCRCACQIPKRYDNLKYQSRGFESLRDLTERRLFGCWDGAQVGLRISIKRCRCTNIING